MGGTKYDQSKPKTHKAGSVKEFIRLGWRLLEHKYRYYCLTSPIISDVEFDKLEAKYRGLAKKLGTSPAASDMVDFDIKRPACKSAVLRVHNITPSPNKIYRLSSTGDVWTQDKHGKLTKIR